MSNPLICAPPSPMIHPHPTPLSVTGLSATICRLHITALHITQPNTFPDEMIRDITQMEKDNMSNWD